jgi:hypothetical protein
MKSSPALAFPLIEVVHDACLLHGIEETDLLSHKNG